MTTYFNAAMLEEAMVEDIGEYPLPDRPDVTVRCKSVTVSRMNQYRESAAKGGAIERRAQAALIFDSIVDEAGKPAFASVEAVYNVASKVRTRRMSGLIQIISLHNGGEDKAKEADLEKKFDETSSDSTSV